MTNQPEALRLADILQHKIPSIKCLEVSAAELRRLHEINQVLVEALKRLHDAVLRVQGIDGVITLENTQAALSKATGESNEVD